MKHLYLLFVISLFFSGTTLFGIHTSGVIFNASPANILLGAAVIFAIGSEYIGLSRSRKDLTILSLVGNTLIRVIQVPRPVVPLIIIATALWGFSLTYFVKDQPHIGPQPILTGLAGLISIWFTAKAIQDIEHLTQVAKLWVVMMVLTSLITIVASADVLPMRSFELITTAPVPIESFIPGFERDVVFGSGADTFGVRILIALSILSLYFLSRKRISEFGIPHSAALVVMLFASVIVQSRPLWISLLLFIALISTLQLTRIRFSRFRPVAISLVSILIISSFIYIGILVGGTTRNGDISQEFALYGYPEIFGFEIPLEFVTNYSIRLTKYEDALLVLTSSPLSGAPSDQLEAYNGHSAYVDLTMLAGIGPLIVIVLMVAYIYRRISISPRTKIPWFEVNVCMIVALLVTNLFFLGLFQKDFDIALTVVVLLPTLLANKESHSTDVENRNPQVPTIT